MNIEKETQSKTSGCITLPDGRTLGYATYGDTSGYPVLAFHGTPGSRLWFEHDDPVAQELGIRLITTDRPGYGRSSPQRGRMLLDYPKDIEVLLDKLDLPYCSVAGTSGGSVFAAACGFALPDKVRKVGLIAGVGEFHRGRPPEGMCRENRSAFWLARNFPFLARQFLKLSRKGMISGPEKYIRQVQQQVAHLCETDQQVMNNPDNARHVLRHMLEAYRQGVKEAVSEMKLVTRPWGFKPEEINCPVEIWHGTQDTLAPIKPMKELAERIPDAVFNEVRGAGHFLDADPDTWRRILESLKPE